VQAGDEVNPELVDKLAGGHALPTLTLTAPKTGDVYSKLVPVSYTSTSTNQVIVYYSTTLADWSGEAIWPNDRVLIAQHLPTKGTYTWTQAKCQSGSSYRIIVDAIGSGGVGAESVSGLFTIGPRCAGIYRVSQPACTHGEDVTVSVDASKDLKMRQL